MMDWTPPPPLACSLTPIHAPTPYNLGNFLRRLVLPRRIKHWSLRTLLSKLIKIGAKVVHHSRMVTFQMAEVAVSKEIWAEMLSRIDRLRWMTA